jgi:hypothetical protein
MLAGCDQSNPKLSKAQVEQLRTHAEQFRAEHPGFTNACFKEALSGEGPAYPTPQDGCFEMQPAKRWRGLWNAGWEWSNFCPEPVRKCPIRADRGDIWLEFANPKAEPNHPDGVFSVEFIGRRTAKAGGFGHLDQYDHEILIDRLISIRKIPGEKYIKR